MKYLENSSTKLSEVLAKRNIRTQSSERTIKNLCERIEKGRINLEADFQREYVWKNNNKLKSRLIESVILEVPIPTIYTAEEEDGSEVVIDGQQRLLTFRDFLQNKFRLTGLSILDELNYKDYKSLGEILQIRIDDFPLRIVKILKDSDQSVKFDIFERLNRGSVQLNDQELRNCIFRGTFNNFLKEIAKDREFQLLIGDREYLRFEDVELALRFFALYERRVNYKSPLKHFLNNFMNDNKDIGNDKIDNYRLIFKKSVYLVKTVFGPNAFYLYVLDPKTKNGDWSKSFNKGLFDVLLVSFTRYEQNHVMAYKDAIKEELYYLMSNDNVLDEIDFISNITGTGTDNTKKLHAKFRIWENSLQQIIGIPYSEPRCFSWQLKNQLWRENPVCEICGQQIEVVLDSEIDHKEPYWRGGRTIPENARLVHRFCNRARTREKFLSNFQ